MNPNMVGTSVEVVVNMANHSPYNGITCHGKMTETKSMKRSVEQKTYTVNYSLFLSYMHKELFCTASSFTGSNIEIDFTSLLAKKFRTILISDKNLSENEIVRNF